jgi:DNA-binding Xre family transcriptional regulator
VPGLAVWTDKQTRADLAGDAAQLYMQGQLHAEIGTALNLTEAQVHKILSELLAEGMPKLERHEMSDRQVRAIHAAYVRGGASIDRRAEAMGFTGSAARQRMRGLKLPVGRQQAPRRPARTPAQAEQRVITALLMAGVDELRKPRGLSLERLAHESDISMWTLQQVRGDLSDPRLTTLLRLCRGLGVTPGELLEDLPLPTEPRLRRARTSRS